MPSPQSPKKPAPKDWHPADIVAALRKAGWSLRQLGIEHGYGHRSSLGLALRAPYPKAEGIIAAALGLKPLQIWPSRYNPDGTTNRMRGMRPLRPAGLPAKPITPAKDGNLQQRQAS